MRRVTIETTPETTAGLSFAPLDAVVIRTVSSGTLDALAYADANPEIIMAQDQ